MIRTLIIILSIVHLTLIPTIGNPIISEFMASNSTVLPDEDGDFSDWIEISNPTDDPIDLGGYHLLIKLRTSRGGHFQELFFSQIPN